YGYPIRIEFSRGAAAAQIELTWSGPGVTSGDVSTTALAPDYGLATSQTDPDGNKVATEFARPELGLPTATVADPAGFALRSPTAYDTLNRVTAQRQPANSYFQAVHADAPVGYWRLDDTNYSALADASGHGHTGSYTGGPVAFEATGALNG